MKNLVMTRGARTLIDDCTHTKSGEDVLIVTDMTKMDIAEAIASVVYEREAEPSIAVMEPRSRDGQEPPKSIASAMKSADVIFTPVSTSITHTNALKDAAANGARAIVMSAFTKDLMISGGIEADFEQQKPICQNVAKTLENGEKVQLSSPVGTNLNFDIQGRPGNSLYCVVEEGEFSTVPTIEANVSPIEGTANGTIVVDASIPYLDIGLIEEPIEVAVADGFITNIKGGMQAKVLEDQLESFDDSNAYNIAEMGIGLNPKCQMKGIMLEDEGVFGTAHIGIGTSITLGGETKAPCHYDLIMWKGKVQVDGETIMESENLKI